MPRFIRADAPRTGRHRRWWRPRRAIVLGALVSGAAWGQPAAPGNAPGPVAQIQSLDRFQAEQERLRGLARQQPQAYDDQFLKADDEPLLGEGSDPASEPTGLRYWLVETQFNRMQRRQSGAPFQSLSESGLRLQYQEETLNHGQWQVFADTRHRSGDPSAGAWGAFSFATRSPTGSRLTARNLGFPLSPSTFADIGLGDINSEVTDGLSRGQRLSLGNSTLRGASLRVFTDTTDLRTGWGQRGQFTGGPYAGFERSSGELSWLGLTRRFENQRYASAQLNRATDTLALLANGRLGLLDSTGYALALGQGYQILDSGDHRLRLTLMGSSDTHADGSAARASGAFAEGAWQAGSYRHEGGLFSTQPQLRFGDQLVADGARGAYWRMDVSGTRLYWGMGLSHERYDDGAAWSPGERSSTGLSFNWNHRLDRRSSWGSYLQLLRLRANSGAIGASGNDSRYASAYYQTRWAGHGDSRLRLTSRHNQQLVSNGPAATGQEIEWEQDWLLNDRETDNTSLRTTLGWARDQSLGQAETYPTAGLDTRLRTDSGWELSLNLRYTSRSGNLSTSRGLAGAVQAEKPLAPGWRLGASLLLNQATLTLNPQALQPGSLAVSRSEDRTAMVYLRYESQRGRGFADTPGAAHGAGAGRISGVVFLDANRDGVQQANEDGVPGVEVLLNARERAITDQRGRFEFALVRTGSQRLSLRPESIPLPWGEGPQSRSVVDVPLRGEAIAPLAVVAPQ